MNAVNFALIKICVSKKDFPQSCQNKLRVDKYALTLFFEIFYFL